MLVHRFYGSVSGRVSAGPDFMSRGGYAGRYGRGHQLGLIYLYIKSSNVISYSSPDGEASVHRSGRAAATRLGDCVPSCWARKIFVPEARNQLVGVWGWGGEISPTLSRLAAFVQDRRRDAGRGWGLQL